MAQRLVSEMLLELLHVPLVPHRLEEVPELVVQLGQLAYLLADVMHRPGEVGRLVALKGAVGGQGAVQFAQQIVTEALDKLLAETPELAALARQVGKQ